MLTFRRRSAIVWFLSLISGDVLTGVPVWALETINSTIILIPGDAFWYFHWYQETYWQTCLFGPDSNCYIWFLILPLISGDVMTDVSVWADNFTILLQFYNPINTILIIIFISGDVLTDVSVWAGQTMYSAHRLVLALSSSYFRSHFIISYFLSPILLPKYVFSLIDLMGKVWQRKLARWCAAAVTKTTEKLWIGSNNDQALNFCLNIWSFRAISCQILGPFPADIFYFDH